MNLPKPVKFEVERYVEGLSKFKKIDNPIKLSANESALGASPKAIQAIEKDKDKIFKYPDSDSNSLREVLSKKFNIDSKRIICGSGSDQIFDLTCHLFLVNGFSGSTLYLSISSHFKSKPIPGFSFGYMKPFLTSSAGVIIFSKTGNQNHKNQLKTK